ncbi:PREDICTED: N(G),N(G)-dimethylarginine dimethylaminohydrolase 1-like isoform X2 [Priapulus caudatus]|uniref:N(G),N(G)-dimethylarginine dimethylaminohydrolase 1-like isoform X2 n=1 Tax=Priapulus caudatus TaxID=37621 RepID=A0ABM1F8W8_PRICU|nr:PREDICTED: N(G),N(G)-dimethylarginine dimethylaminohydrolase 1-like isoform X2 [Priapulus caudatus]
MASRYTHAVVCRVPSSITKSASENANEGELDITKAREEHELFVATLRKLGVDVIELPQDETLPDSCFVEDTAVVINGTALLTKPGKAERRKEVEIIRSTLKKELPELQIIEIDDEKATLDGADVLFTGKEIFVGLSKHTNGNGAIAVANTFPEFPTSPVRVTGVPHLKSVMCMVAPSVLAVASSQEGKDILHRVEGKAEFTYQVMMIPDTKAVNCIYVNGSVVHRSDIPSGNKVFESKLGELPRCPLSLSQLEKAGGTLSSCALLINKGVYGY